MSESYLKNKIIEYIRKNDYGWVVKYHSHMYGSAGVPDLLIIMEGVAVECEVKTEKGRLTPLQDVTLKEITEKGKGISFVAWGFADFKQKIEKIRKEVIECRMGNEQRLLRLQKEKILYHQCWKNT